MRQEWMLTARRLPAMELDFYKKAMDDLDCTAAIVALKSSERPATLTGANAPGAARVRVANVGGEEFDIAPGRLRANLGNQRRHHV